MLFHFVTSLACANDGQPPKSSVHACPSLSAAAEIAPRWSRHQLPPDGSRSQMGRLVSLGPQHGTTRAGEEAGLEEQREDLSLGDGLAVEALDCEPLFAGAPLHMLDECLERGA